MDRDSKREPFQVLLAEDNPAGTFLVHEALKQQAIEYEMHVVNDGEKAFRFLDRVEKGELPCPDVVLLDLNLPCKTGVDVLARMRRSDICREVRVVALTSSDAPLDGQAMQELGIEHYLRKPTGFEDFMKLGELIRRQLESGA
jgi:CheY-like chemotaxis protein